MSADSDPTRWLEVDSDVSPELADLLRAGAAELPNQAAAATPR